MLPMSHVAGHRLDYRLNLALVHFVCLGHLGESFVPIGKGGIQFGQKATVLCPHAVGGCLLGSQE